MELLPRVWGFLAGSRGTRCRRVAIRGRPYSRRYRGSRLTRLPRAKRFTWGQGLPLVDGAGAVCTAAGVELLAATGQTGFSIPFPATSFPTFGGYTHVTSPTPGGTYLNTLYSWHKISLSVVRVNGGAGTPIESYSTQASQTTEYIVYDADGTALRFRVENGQIKPAFGVYAELIRLGDTFAVVGGPPGALNQKGAWVYFFTGASPGAYAWGSAPKARVLAIRDPQGNYWHTARDPNNSRWVVWKSPNSVYLAFDPETGYVYYSANTNPPQWQPLGKTPGALSGGAPRGGGEVIYWGDPSDPQGHIAYQWSVQKLPPATTRITLEAGYLGNGGVFVPQAKKDWLFGDDSNGYTNGRNERDLYAAMYGEVPANLYGRLHEQLWGTVSKTKLEYRPASPFGVETKIYRESLNQDYTLLRHIDGDSDKKFNIVEVERPRFDGSGVSLERVFLSPTNGQPVLREFFEGRNDRSSLWQEQYEYNYPADPLALTGYVDRQGNRYQWEYRQLSTGISWRDGRTEQETVLTRAVDPTGVEVSLRYGEEYTIPPWQVVRQNPPTVPSSVQLGSNSERRWRFAYTFTADPQRGAPNGLLLGFREPERNWWRFGYTSLSHPHPYQLTQITDPTERFSRITAGDAFGRPTRSEVYPYQGEFGWDTNRPVWQEIEYDPVGRVQRVLWGYDEHGQRYPSGSVRYNWVGHLLVGFTDARGRQVQFEYDPFRRGLLSEIKINGQRYAALGYDWHGRLTSVIGGNGVGIEYTYTYRDALQTIRHTGDPTPEEFRYSDCCGQVSSWKRQDGQQLFFDYTLNGWLREVRYKGVGDSRTRTLYTYAYDPAGRLTAAQSEISTVNYTYDTTDGDRTGWLERTDTTLSNHTYTFDYSYYLNGDLRSFSWRRQGAWLPFSTQRFTYDDAGRLATQSYALGGIGSQIGLMVDYAYDGAGRLTQQQVRVQVGAQQRTLTTSLQYADYWSIGSVWTQSVLLDGRTVANYAYSYYEDGTLRTAFEQHTEPNGSSSQRQLGWDYYSDGSLQYERIGSQQRNFQYDLGGNLTLGVPAAPTLTAQYEYNQLRSLGNWEFAYNPNGERVGEQNAPDGAREYGYDGFGNLIRVKRNGQLVYEARYDALGRRVAYRTSSYDWDWVYLLYDGDMLVAELDAYGQVRAEYVWGSLGPVARIAGGRVQLYVCDALGHVRALIDAETAQITDRYDYDAWGNVVHNGSTRQPFTWNGAYGYEWMPEVSLYHVGARAYDPRIARWLQRDPIDAASGDPNLYRYCGNEPVSSWDDGAQRQKKQRRNPSSQRKKPRNPLNLQQLPEGIGYYSYVSRDRQYACPKMIECLQNVGLVFNALTGSEFGVGDISKQGGGEFPPHKSHQRGVDADVRPIRTDCARKGVKVGDKQYDRERTLLLVLLFRILCDVDVIGFQDATLEKEVEQYIGDVVRAWKGHADHLHVRLKRCE